MHVETKHSLELVEAALHIHMRVIRDDDYVKEMTQLLKTVQNSFKPLN